MEKKMENDMETGKILGILGVIVEIETPSIPRSNPYNNPCISPIYTPLLRSLDYCLYGFSYSTSKCFGCTVVLGFFDMFLQKFPGNITPKP